MQNPSSARFNLLDIDFVASEQMRVDTGTVWAGFTMLHGAVCFAAALAEGHRGNRFDPQGSAAQQLRTVCRPPPAILQIRINDGRNLPDFQRNRGNGAQMILRPNLLQAADDMKHNTKLMHRIIVPSS